MRWFHNRAQDDLEERTQRAQEACEREAARRKAEADRTWAHAFILLRRAHERRRARRAREQMECLTTRR